MLDYGDIGGLALLLRERNPILSAETAVAVLERLVVDEDGWLPQENLPRYDYRLRGQLIARDRLGRLHFVDGVAAWIESWRYVTI